MKTALRVETYNIAGKAITFVIDETKTAKGNTTD